ncbi:hypothetical protein OA509_00370 [Prochlorococcus sp. AH-716-I19]|nr:hypothetical protein [Prochlorococcus sp. AH-716-I19]
MNMNKNENSLKNNLYDTNKITSKKIKFFNLKFIHRLFDSVNISLLILIFILSFLSFNSQRKWTRIYKNLLKTRANNNNLIDYISKTEEFYINKIDSLNTFKKTTPKDLIYLDKQITPNKNNYLNKKIKFIKDGLKDSKYQKGY